MCLKIESRWKEIIQSKNYNIIQVAMNRNKDLILIEINQTLINTDQQITCLYLEITGFQILKVLYIQDNGV